jgi:hypothetical protein
MSVLVSMFEGRCNGSGWAVYEVKDAGKRIVYVLDYSWSNEWNGSVATAVRLSESDE